MSFVERRDEFFVNVKGLSMWPALISGDILKAKKTMTKDLEPSDIIVLHLESTRPIVHRIREIEVLEGSSIILRTAGDRAGFDPPDEVGRNQELLRVIGVLRRGRWKKVMSRLPQFICSMPYFVIRLHCAYVRKFQW